MADDDVGKALDNLKINYNKGGLVDKIDWYQLSTNSAAIHLLEQNINKISWWCLCKNSYDY